MIDVIKHIVLVLLTLLYTGIFRPYFTRVGVYMPPPSLVPHEQQII